MHSRSLPRPAVAGLAAAAQRQLAALLGAWRQLRERRARARALWRAERELATMSLHGLRDIGASEALLARRFRDRAQRPELYG